MSINSARKVYFGILLSGIFVFLSVCASSVRAATEASNFHNLSAETGGAAGQVALHWNHYFNDVQNYNLLFGTEPGKYQYGAVGIGKVNSYTVNYLSPNTKYYFAISPVRGGKAQFVSFEVSAVSKGGVVTPPPATQVSTPTASSTDVSKTDSFNNQSKDQIKSKGVGVHQLSAKKVAKGQVELKWKQTLKDVDNYSIIVYGTEPGKFQYGALNVGKTDKFTVKDLDPNKHYYFAIVPVKGGKAQYITQQVTDAGAPSQPSASTNSNTTNSNNNSNSNSTTTTGTGSGSSGNSIQQNITNTINNIVNPSGSSTSTNTTNSGSTPTTNSKKNEDNNGQSKKVKGESTSLDFWAWLKSLLTGQL